MKANRLLFYYLACLFLVTAGINGCVSENSTSDKTNDVATMELIIGVMRPAIGFEIMLIPKNSEGFIVEAEGDINIKLFWQTDSGEYAAKAGLFREWSIHINRDDCTPGLGIVIPLTFDVDESVFYKDARGFLEVNALMENNATFFLKMIDLEISTDYRCC